jgi:ATP-dependent exoDNAse (exonuclease V) alpha subunit
LGSAELEAGGLRFAAGDRVVVRRNDRHVDVRNGDRGIVTRVDRTAGAVTVRIGERERRLPPEFLARTARNGDPVLQHGYAITAYVAQGLTCRSSLVLIHDDADQEWAYTALSRGTDSNRLYTVSETVGDRAEYAPASPRQDPDRRLSASLQRSRQQRLASDYGVDVLHLVRAHEAAERLRERRQQHSVERDSGRGL